mgnify:CR=1 FL=1
MSLVRALLTAGRSALAERGGVAAIRPFSRALAQPVRITFVDKDGSEVPVDAPVGKSLLEVAHENDIELEGACDGSLACSTCHLILDEVSFKKLKAPEDEELDMLDLAFDLRKTCARLRPARRARRARARVRAARRECMPSSATFTRATPARPVPPARPPHVSPIAAQLAARVPG